MIKLRIHDPRILAIDLRHRRFGFAVFEGPRRLLGWGVRIYPATGEAEASMMSNRLIGLLKLYSPSVIVVTKERWDRAESNPRIRALAEEILRLANAGQIPIRAIGQMQIRRSFLPMESETRQEIAASLAHIFPELAARLPPERRAWESEHSVMTVFDAVALGLTYWLQDSESIFFPDERTDIG